MDQQDPFRIHFGSTRDSGLRHCLQSWGTNMAVTGRWGYDNWPFERPPQSYDCLTGLEIFGTMESYDCPYIGNNHPSWRLIFFRGVETTNQISVAYDHCWLGSPLPTIRIQHLPSWLLYQPTHVPKPFFEGCWESAEFHWSSSNKKWVPWCISQGWRPKHT